MRSSIILLFFLSTIFSAFSQNNSISISGTVRSNDTNEPIENAGVRLKSSSGLMLESKTDVFGNYYFEIKNDSSSTIELSCYSDKLTKSGTPSPCGWLANHDIGKAKLNPNTNIIKDFTLTRIKDCGTVPYILFYKNSTKSCNDSLHKIKASEYNLYDEAISVYESILAGNPTIVIEIDGHASSLEEQPEELSLQRAETIKAILVARGINKGRIYTKGWGNKKLLVPDQIINDKTTGEKITLHLKNQRVIFKILNWDFKE